jgi:hypothetical protein
MHYKEFPIIGRIIAEPTGRRTAGQPARPSTRNLWAAARLDSAGTGMPPGLFHSIYGTVHFRHQSWPLSDRATIGDEAENLAYLFCTLDRPRVLVEKAAAGSRAAVLLDLLEIEAANLLDQGGAPWLDRIAPYVSEAGRKSLGMVDL